MPDFRGIPRNVIVIVPCARRKRFSRKAGLSTIDYCAMRVARKRHPAPTVYTYVTRTRKLTWQFIYSVRHQDRDSRKRNVWGNSIFRIRFRLLDRRDAVSRVEMDHRQKERSIEISNEQYLSWIALEVVLLPYANRPIKLKSLPRLDPRTGIWPNSVCCYHQIKSHTWWISYWVLANTSLDPMVY